jgi:tRNA-dihydrouridine synthase 1
MSVIGVSRVRVCRSPRIYNLSTLFVRLSHGNTILKKPIVLAKLHMLRQPFVQSTNTLSNIIKLKPFLASKPHIFLRHQSTTMAPKLRGRAFYESLGSPKYIVAPMVDQSEFAWRLLTRSFLPPDLRTSVLAYSPMMHAKLFSEKAGYRSEHFKPLKNPVILPTPADKEDQKALAANAEPHLDGNPQIDRPLFMQFCANDPDALLAAAQIVQPYVDAVDLNLGCPQGIAKRGNYGAFLQEDWGLIYRLINKLHENLDVPVTAKMRVLETREKTLDYAKMILSAGASILTVHGRQRDQKGHWTGLADWEIIRYLRDNLPKETVMFANGNILQYGDLQKCLDATGVDGIMSAEGNLYDPSIFAPPPPVGEEGREYWRGRNGLGGYRADAVLRRYLDIIYKHVLNQEPPARAPLFLPSDPTPAPSPVPETDVPQNAESDKRKAESTSEDTPAAKKQKRAQMARPARDANLTATQAHLFHMLRALVSAHTNVRDALARCKGGDMAAYENVLSMVENVVREGILGYEKDPSAYETAEAEALVEVSPEDEALSSDGAVKRCKRPFWVCQSHVRPLPKEAMEKGSIQLSKKEKAKLAAAGEVGLPAGGSTEEVKVPGSEQKKPDEAAETVEVPKEGMVCG